MAGIGTRAGICPGYIPTPNNTCKLCGKREYQHTFEGNDVPIEIAKSKVPFFELMDPSEGSIYGGSRIIIICIYKRNIYSWKWINSKLRQSNYSH